MAVDGEAMKLLLASPIADAAIRRLEESHEIVRGFESGSDLAELAESCQGIVFRSGVEISSDVIAPGVALLVRAGSGLDNVDLDAARDRGVRVARVPGESPDAVAELTLGLMLTAVRHISRADALVRQGRWPKRELAGRLIAGKTLGVIGAGRIGSKTGALCAALGMRVIGCVELPSADIEADLAAQGIELCDFDTVLENSDIVSVHTPLNAETHHLVDRTAIAKMKRGAVLINTARGSVVDEVATYDALRSGHLSAAGFDVHESEGEGVVPKLADLPNVVLTPHIGGMALETQEAIGFRVATIVDAFEEGRLDEVLADEERVL